jgi:hypothetical protein
MNAPLKIQIDDATQRKARLWDAVESGELGTNEVNLIMEALTALAEHKVALAFELEKAGRKLETPVSQMSGLLRRTAADARDLRDKFDGFGNAYIMPGDV